MSEHVSDHTMSQRHKGIRRRLRLLIIAVLGFMSWAGITFWDQSDLVGAKFEQLSVLQGKLDQVTQTNEDYKQQVMKLNDPEYIEQIVRKNFQMTRDGETLFITPKSEE